MTAEVFDNRISTLAEGPLWHPLRKQLFWFDILGSKLLTRSAAGAKSWDIGEYASAAGWIDHDRLLVATETGLFDFDIESGEKTRIADIEADQPQMRSNDGRADPWGGFWIGTMGKGDNRDGAGRIYRFYRGEVRKIVSGLTIPNSICFSLDRRFGYYSDTATQKMMRVALEGEHGWFAGEPEVFRDFSTDDLSPDGAVTDAYGNIWVALWGAAKVAAYDSDGRLLKEVAFDAPQTTCPAFGGNDLTTLYVTSAREHMDEDTAAKNPKSGMIFAADGAGQGRAEPQVTL